MKKYIRHILALFVWVFWVIAWLTDIDIEARFIFSFFGGALLGLLTWGDKELGL